MTYLEAINSVLAKLRHVSVASPTSTEFAITVGTYVNEAKRYVEDAWDWRVLRSDEEITTSATVATYSIPSSNERTRLLRDRASDIWLLRNTTKGWWMRELPEAAYMQWIENPQEDSPSRFMWRGVSAGARQIRVYPTPDAVETLTGVFITPQSDLTTGSTDITVPYYPVILWAYYYMISERGENRGTTAAEARDRAMTALSDAIAQDGGQSTMELTLVPDTILERRIN